MQHRSNDFGTPEDIITRRRFLNTGVGAPALLAKAPARPNILWICTDQQRYDTIAALGNPHIRTPNLDRLAASGLTFRNAYCQSPVCTPSRASFLTGCYPSTTHVHRNGNGWFPQEWVPRLISRILADAGYDCGLAGKLHISSCKTRPEPRVADGYRVFKWSHTPRPTPAWPPPTDAYQEWLHAQGVDWATAFGAVKLKGWPAEYQAGVAARYSHSTWCAAEAISFLSERRSAPWLMSVNLFEPHPLAPPSAVPGNKAERPVVAALSEGEFHPPPEKLARMKPDEMPLPYFAEGDLENQHALREVAHQTTKARRPSEYPARHMMAAYYASVELIDDQVGRMLDALEKTGQRENTIVLFHSDHGEMLGDHGLMAKGCRFYEGAVHVPLIFSWPARFHARGSASGLVELTDIVPTLLDAVGLPVPDYVEGRSLFPLLTGAAEPARHRPFVRSEYHDAIVSRLPKPTHANMYFDGRWKLVVYHGLGVGELYDLTEDPHEFRNRWNAPAFQDVQTRLIGKLFDEIMVSTDLGQPRIASS